MKTLAVIPCYNESRRIDPFAFLEFVEHNTDIEFLFVNDGSRDNTKEILTNICEQNCRFHSLDLNPNRGKAEAVRKGFLHAVDTYNFDYIAYWDADLQIPLCELVTFVQIAEEGFDMVTAMRIQRLGVTMKRSLTRHILSRCFATCASMALDLPVYDTQCGAKLFRRDIVAELFTKPFLSKWLFDIELLARYKKYYGKEYACKKIIEQPLRHLVDAEGSNIKLIDWLKSPIELLKIMKKYQ